VKERHLPRYSPIRSDGERTCPFIASLCRAFVAPAFPEDGSGSTHRNEPWAGREQGVVLVVIRSQRPAHRAPDPSRDRVR